MGRKVGVTSEQTRAELLSAAAEIFAQKGYDGASISDITRESGLSSGAIYSHYGSKAGLFFAVVEERGRQEFTDLVGADHLENYSELNEHVADMSEFLSCSPAPRRSRVVARHAADGRGNRGLEATPRGR